MSHATPEEIHDHAHGFRASGHVGSCAECRLKADIIASEREALRDALADPPGEAPAGLISRLATLKVPRRRALPLSLCAAGLLLALLGWMLFQPHLPGRPTNPAASSQALENEEIDRLIARLRGPTPLEQELARLALKAYGGTALEKLEQAHADPGLIAECRGISPADQALLGQLKSTRVNIDMTTSPLIAFAEFLREVGRISIHVSGIEQLDRITVTMKYSDITLYDLLEHLRTTNHIPYSVLGGVVVLGGSRPDPASWAPVRILAIRDWAARQISELGRSKKDAAAVLDRLSNAADPGLWEILESPDVELRGLAESALRRLYDRSVRPAAPSSDLEMVLNTRKMDVSFENARLLEILSYLSRTGGVSFMLIPPCGSPQQTVTFKVKDLVMTNILKLLLSQFQLDFVPRNGVVCISSPENRPQPGRPPGALWTLAEEARRIETLIDGLASDDPKRQLKARQELHAAGRAALTWLAHAAQVLPEDASRRCSLLMRDIADAQGVWLTDQVSGAEVQHLSAAERAILERPVTYRGEHKTLEEILRGEQIPCLFKVTLAAPLACALHELTIGSLMRAATRPLGMDFYLEGGVLVVDTAAHVRSVVGQP